MSLNKTIVHPSLVSITEDLDSESGMDRKHSEPRSYVFLRVHGTRIHKNNI